VRDIIQARPRSTAWEAFLLVVRRLATPAAVPAFIDNRPLQFHGGRILSQPETCCDRTPTQPERCPNGPLGGHPPTPTSKPLLGVHNLSPTSYELDGVSGTYGPSCVGRRVSRQQINQLPPTPRGPRIGAHHSGVQLQKYHSGSISRALHCLENSMTLACVRRASFGAKRGATSRKLRPPGGRGFFLVGGPSRSLISRSPAISANRCGGFPVAIHQFRLCS
jgi:hypothetical protein